MASIVVLDGYTLNPGDLSWKELEALGDCRVFDRTPDAEVIACAATAEIVLTNKTRLTREQIQKLPRLKYIGILATGTNVVDLASATGLGIVVTNVPAYGTKSVAQTTFALLLEFTHHVGHHARTVREGKWSEHADWSYWDRPLLELDGLTLGIIGLGRIGRAVAEMGRAFGMKVIAAQHSSRPADSFIEVTELEAVFRRSDVLSLHCPLTPETEKIINARTLGWMKSSALLLNTSRGLLIDEPALADALNSGRLAGAGLDVLSVEPPPADNPLLKAKNCVITPHLAWGTFAARSRLMRIAVQNVRAFLNGSPQNRVN